MNLIKLNSKIKYLWAFFGALLGLIVSGIFVGILYFFTGPISAVIIPVFALLGVLYGLKRYSNWGFKVVDDHLYIEHGVIKKTYSMVPYVRVQHIDTDRGPIDRFLGLSTLRVYTAGSKGADIRIPGLDRQEASELQKKLRDAAISSEKGFDAV
ncbi:MAG: membrane protein YdbS with pleckstrin-like domain [Candidatus Nanohaloarchaea archaeon]|jgi:membrane protein YdbS with pleckstrin-like domain